VAVIVERGAEPKIKDAGYKYLAAYQLADLGL
jgi:orotate phosphoribosyltransferase